MTPIAHNAAGQTGVIPPLQSLSPLSVHMHTPSPYSLSMTDISTLFQNTHTDKLSWEIPNEASSQFPIKGGGPKLIKPNHRPQFKHLLLLLVFLKPYLKSELIKTQKHSFICQSKTF